MKSSEVYIYCAKINNKTRHLIQFKEPIYSNTDSLPLRRTPTTSSTGGGGGTTPFHLQMGFIYNFKRHHHNKITGQVSIPNITPVVAAAYTKATQQSPTLAKEAAQTSGQALECISGYRLVNTLGENNISVKREAERRSDFQERSQPASRGCDM